MTLVLLGALCLWAATPPAPLPGAEFLILAGLMAWFRLADDESVRRRYLMVWLLGTLHTWPRRHLLNQPGVRQLYWSRRRGGCSDSPESHGPRSSR